MSIETNGVGFREAVANWRGQVYQALKEIDKWHDRFERRLRDLEKSNGDRFQELDDKIDEVKDLIRTESTKTFEGLRKELRQEKDIMYECFSKIGNEQRLEIDTMKKRLSSIYVKVSIVGASVGVSSAIVFGIFQKYIIKLLGL